MCHVCTLERRELGTGGGGQRLPWVGRLCAMCMSSPGACLRATFARGAWKAEFAVGTQAGSLLYACSGRGVRSIPTETMYSALRTHAPRQLWKIRAPPSMAPGCTARSQSTTKARLGHAPTPRTTHPRLAPRLGRRIQPPPLPINSPPTPEPTRGGVRVGELPQW